VVRVTARLTAEPEDPARAAVRGRLLAAASALIDAARPGDSNQALMELGATVCQPRAPRCGECPLSETCAALAAGRVEAFPPPRRRPASVAVRQVAAVVEGPGGTYLLVRRPAAEPVLPGLWELPTVEAEQPDAAERALGERFGGRWRLGESVIRLRHGITFRAIEIDARRARWQTGGVAESGEAVWVDPARRDELALTGTARKLLARLT
jgi:A/G-specific adenine glycosylase